MSSADFRADTQPQFGLVGAFPSLLVRGSNQPFLFLPYYISGKNSLKHAMPLEPFAVFWIFQVLVCGLEIVVAVEHDSLLVETVVVWALR